MPARFTVDDAGIWYGDQRLSSRDALLADSRELSALTDDDGVKHLQMPGRIDLVFTAGDKVVGVESKKAQDFVDSFYSRRLHRQLRMLRELVDIPAIGLRGYAPDFIEDYRDAIVNIVRVQALGTYLLPLPLDDNECLSWLLEYRAILTKGSRSALTAISGSDNQLRGKGLLISQVRGLGAKRVDKLLRLAVNKSDDDELRLAIGERLAKKLREII